MTTIEKFNEEPDIIEFLDNGAAFIPILSLEEMLDELDSWSTQNFSYTLYKDSYGKHSVAASIELVIEYKKDGQPVKRTLVGAANFDVKSMYPNTHFLATIKSECIKNAASDIGIRFGRGINKDLVPKEEVELEKLSGHGPSLIDSLEDLNLSSYASKIKNK